MKLSRAVSNILHLLPEDMREDYNKRRIDDVLNRLEPRDRRIVSMRYGLEDGEPKTLQEIGDEVGLTKEAVFYRLNKIVKRKDKRVLRKG